MKIALFSWLTITICTEAIKGSKMVNFNDAFTDASDIGFWR